jgi:transposase
MAMTRRPTSTIGLIGLQATNTIGYIMLTRRQPYQDLGAAYFDQREQHRVERRLVQRLERLGYEVALQPRALAS